MALVKYIPLCGNEKKYIYVYIYIFISVSIYIYNIKYIYKYIYIYIYIYYILYMYIFDIQKWKKLLNFFALRENEIKYVEKQRKLLHFFPPCRNECISILKFRYFFCFLLFGSNMDHYVKVKRIGEIETEI